MIPLTYNTQIIQISLVCFSFPAIFRQQITDLPTICFGTYCGWQGIAIHIQPGEVKTSGQTQKITITHKTKQNKTKRHKNVPRKHSKRCTFPTAAKGI